jgi:hypothetical protein
MNFWEISDTTKKDYDLNIEPHLNVVGEIKRSEIKTDDGGIHEATYARLNPSGKFIEKLYRFEDVKYRDGSVSRIFQHSGERSGWHNSYLNREDKIHSNVFYSKDYKKLKEIKFLKIID